MITTREALDHLLALTAPLTTETVPLADANGRVMATSATALRDQPPFASSAMDGYAVRTNDVQEGDTFEVVGEAAAGHAFKGDLKDGQAVRIFTGAPVPEGAGRVIIQEDVSVSGSTITLGSRIDKSSNIRPKAGDFEAGAVLTGPRRLGPSDIALLASMGHGDVAVTRKPVIAVIATGDELVYPGETPRPDQIIASNSFGLKAMLEAAGAQVRLLPIAKDTLSSLETVFGMAEGADLVITIGGASVGDHDLVAQAADNFGMERSFYKVAMRPGKPLMAGKLRNAAMVGLPGNPVSSMVCGEIFILPMIDRFLGLPAGPRPRTRLPLAADLPENGPREHYMRAKTTPDGVSAFPRQDSSLLTILADADVLIVRPPHDPVRVAGEHVDVIKI